MLNKNTSKKLIILLILFLILISMPVPIFAEQGKDDYNIFYLMEIMAIIQENYLYDISREELIEGAIKGLFNKLDSHSEYFTKEEFRNFIEKTSGDFVGIGIYIGERNGHIKIVEVIEGGPAHKEGLQAGDIIVEIDGQNVAGLTVDEVAQLIRGEENTYVNIKVKRNKKNIVYEIKRQVVQMNPIKYYTIDDNIAYIKISNFNEHTTENLERVLKEIDKKSITNIIVDLRNNPGGLLMEVVKSLRFFIPEGPIVHVKHKGGVVETLYSTLKEPKYNLVVLINEYSASASEIFAGAVQDTGAGKIIGTPSYGKGTIQMLLPLPYGDGIKITVGEYLTPNMRSINMREIEPDIVVENKDDEDLQLKRAIVYLRAIEKFVTQL